MLPWGWAGVLVAWWHHVLHSRHSCGAVGHIFNELFDLDVEINDA